MIIRNFPGQGRNKRPAWAIEAEAVKNAERRNTPPEPPHTKLGQILNSGKFPQVTHDVPAHMFGKNYVGGRASQRELEKKEGYVPFERVSERVRKMPKTAFNREGDDWQQFLKDTKEDVSAKAGLNVEQADLEMKARKVTGSLRDKIKAREAGKSVKDNRDAV